MTNQVICPQCNTPNRADARYCRWCGYVLSGSGPLTGAEAVPRSAPSPNTMPTGQPTGQLSPGTQLNRRYVVERTLGRGGMGAVYYVADSSLRNRHWAMKEVSASALATPEERREAVDVFKNEADLLSDLDHPNLPKVIDYFTQDGRQYLVMDYVDGQTFQDLLDQRGGQPFPESQVIGWARQICDVLNYLHTHNPPVIFRDLKPSNIMIDKQGRIKLIDFGIARMFKPGQKKDTRQFGTAGFAAPEQYGRGQTDARSDVYALGATLHYLLTGRDPSETPFQFPPVRSLAANVSTQVDQAIARAVDTRPEARWQTIREFCQAMTQPAPQAVMSAPPPQPVFVPPPITSRQVVQPAPAPAVQPSAKPAARPAPVPAATPSSPLTQAPLWLTLVVVTGLAFLCALGLILNWPLSQIAITDPRLKLLAQIVLDTSYRLLPSLAAFRLTRRPGAAWLCGMVFVFLASASQPSLQPLQYVVQYAIVYGLMELIFAAGLYRYTNLFVIAIAAGLSVTALVLGENIPRDSLSSLSELGGRYGGALLASAVVSILPSWKWRRNP